MYNAYIKDLPKPYFKKIIKVTWLIDFMSNVVVKLGAQIIVGGASFSVFYFNQSRNFIANKSSYLLIAIISKFCVLIKSTQKLNVFKQANYGDVLGGIRAHL